MFQFPHHLGPKAPCRSNGANIPLSPTTPNLHKSLSQRPSISKSRSDQRHGSGQRPITRHPKQPLCNPFPPSDATRPEPMPYERMDHGHCTLRTHVPQ